MKISFTDTERKCCGDCCYDLDDRQLLLVGRSTHPEDNNAPVYRCLICEEERLEKEGAA